MGKPKASEGTDTWLTTNRKGAAGQIEKMGGTDELSQAKYSALIEHTIAIRKDYNSPQLSCFVQPSKSAICPAVFYNAVNGFFLLHPCPKSPTQTHLNSLN
jgi:hypothetical protein